MVVQIEKLRHLRNLQRLERVFPRGRLPSHSTVHDDPIMRKLRRLHEQLRELRDRHIHVPDEPA